jgi:hypothetical protein
MIAIKHCGTVIAVALSAKATIILPAALHASPCELPPAAAAAPPLLLQQHAALPPAQHIQAAAQAQHTGLIAMLLWPKQ